MKLPTKNTLRKYGLTESDYKIRWLLQGERCPICGRSDAPMVIDHEHVRGWGKMKPEQRRKFVRGIICSWDNRWIVGRGATVENLRSGSEYLQDYRERKQK